MQTITKHKTEKYTTLKVASPYQLSNQGISSDQFYSTIDIFSEKITTEGHKLFSDKINQYRSNLLNTSKSINQNADENLLDILILGVLWNEYKGCWGSTSIISQERLLKQFYKIRSYHPAMKDRIDIVRGKLGYRLLNNPQDENAEITLENLKLLCFWLSATNEYNEEVQRIESWIKFLENISQIQVPTFLNEIVCFSYWFKIEAKKELYNYTSGVDAFLKNHDDNYKNKEDYFFTGRKEVEYHLNMVGAAIMNKSMRKDFENTQHQILLLPTCMAKNENCKSVELMTGRVCKHCTADCNISKVSNEARKQGIQTFLISHSSSFSEYLKKWANQKQIGLIGTACALNLLMGGFEMKRLNIPAQCVFLEYSACKKHWKQNGIATNINLNQVQKLSTNRNLSTA